MINSLNKNINFTCITQINNKIKLLDFTINETNNKFNFNTYWKPTQTVVIISNGSKHPFSQKVSYCNFVFHRFRRISLKYTK